MKAIILASGEGSRLRPLTDTTPKPLIKILGKSIIEYNLELLRDFVDECIIIVRYKSEQFEELIGDEYMGMKVSYHKQGEKTGTAAAIEDIEVNTNDKLLILYGDSIYPKGDIKNIILSHEYGCLVKEVQNPEAYGIFEQKDGLATRVIEKPTQDVGNLANMGGFFVSGELIELCKGVEPSQRGEYEITDAINTYVMKYPFRLHKLTGEILDIGYPWNLLDANNIFLSDIEESDIKGSIEENVHIHGHIILEEGAIIKSGTYIEGNCYFGKNTIIGPNAYVRGNTSLGDNSKIGFSVEVKNSYIGENTKISHLSYLGDSIVGNNVNLGCGFKVANLRHDGKNMRTMVKGELIDTGKRKLGCIVGDNTMAGINTQVYPGRVLSTGTATIPGETVK